MITILPLLAMAVSVQMDHEFRVVSVKSESHYAGKLGDLIQETLTVERGGKTYTVKMDPFHTACNHGSRGHREGDMVRLYGPIHGDQIDPR